MELPSIFQSDAMYLVGMLALFLIVSLVFNLAHMQQISGLKSELFATKAQKKILEADKKDLESQVSKWTETYTDKFREAKKLEAKLQRAESKLKMFPDKDPITGRWASRKKMQPQTAN